MELSAEILHSSVANMKSLSSERRQHARLPFRFRVKIIPYENRTCSAPISLLTRDISPSGIGLIHQKPLREGSKFIIRLPRTFDTPILLLCTVRNSIRLAKDVYGIGASFAEVAESQLTQTPANEPIAPVPFAANILLGPELTEEIRRVSEAILA